MGGGSYSTDTRATRMAAKLAAGHTTFHYSDQIRSGRVAAKVHDLLDPKWTAGDKSPNAGKIIREVCISDEHPEPTAIAIVLDVTGSNYNAAVAAHAKLPELHGFILRKGYVSDPMISFSATGDANCDRVPLQIGQYESDNRMEETLENIVLEGGGGGQVRETYELAAYYYARHTYLEPWEKQGRKGYVFFIGDEMPYDVVRKGHVQQYIGGGLEANVSTKEIFDELQEKNHVFFLFQAQGAYDESRILPAWRELLGERALVLDDPNAVVETIALTLGLMEGTVTLEDGLEDLSQVSTDLSAVKAAGKALATVGANAGSGAAVATVEGDALDLDGDGAERL